jgi:hypothetical protein
MTLHYQITVKEYLEASWSDWFSGLTITHAEDGSTILTGAVRDQTALYGLVASIRDLGLTLVSAVPYIPSTTTDVPPQLD